MNLTRDSERLVKIFPDNDGKRRYIDKCINQFISGLRDDLDFLYDYMEFHVDDGVVTMVINMDEVPYDTMRDMFGKWSRVYD